MTRRLSAWATGLFLVTASALALTSACSSDDSGGGSSSGGADSGTGGSATGGSGGTGGTSTTGGTGGTTSDGGCDPAPTDPTNPTACDTCQDDTHAGCACATEIDACLNDNDCSAIWDCAIDGTDAGVGVCEYLDADGAVCELACMDLYPNGKALYLAMDKCMYCQYCAQACETGEYCSALDNPPDGGTDAATDATTDAATDASDDASSDASSDATSE